MTMDEKTLNALALAGDLSGLSETQLRAFYLKACESIGCSPFVMPFSLLTLSGKRVLYANRTATDAIAARLEIQRIPTQHPTVVTVDGKKFVEARVKAVAKSGRWEERTGCVSLTNYPVDVKKAETQAARRATLALGGLGFMDQSEVVEIAKPDIIALGEGDTRALLGLEAPSNPDSMATVLLSLSGAELKAKAAEYASALSIAHGVTYDEAKAMLNRAYKAAKGL